MRFVNINKATNGNYYIVETKKDEDGLGTISFYNIWKKWVFEPEGDTMYDSVCMFEIAEFMKKLDKNVDH